MKIWLIQVLQAAEVESLKQDSIKLTHSISKVQRKLAYVKDIKDNCSEIISEGTIGKFILSLRILKAANGAIFQLKQFRLLELGDVEMPKSNTQLLAVLRSQDPKGPQTTSDSFQYLPQDLLKIISTAARKSYGDIIVNDLKKVVAIGQDTDSRFSLEEDIFILQRTALKMIDFLIRNECANPESVRNMFQEIDVVKGIANYSNLSYIHDMRGGWGWITLSYSSPMTGHWYWRYRHESLRVLSEREERNVNFYFSLKTLQHEFENEDILDSPLTLLLKKSSLIDRLWAGFETNKHTSINPSIGKNENSGEDFREDFRHMMDLIMSYLDDGSHFRAAICLFLLRLLELIDKYLSPGLLKEVVQSHSKSQDLQNRFHYIQS